MADDKLINIIRPTLIKAQREVAAYEKKRDAMRGRVNLAEANRSSTGSILTAETVGQKLFNAASFLSAGAKEAACKTELAMLERQIRGFKEEFGVELYPVFQSMEDNEGWLPTDRKVRSLYDQAREDIAEMEKSKEEKREQIRQLEGMEGSGLTPPTVPVAQTQNVVAPMVVATPVTTPVPSNYQTNGQAPWASAAPDNSNAGAFGTSYGSAHPSTSYGSSQLSNQLASIENKSQSHTSFDFMQNEPSATPATSQTSNPMGLAQISTPYGNNSINSSSVFDPFDGLSAVPEKHNSGQTNTTFATTISSATTHKNTFDPFSNNSTSLSDADMNLFKY